MLFYPHLRPGSYRVRVAITDPNLTAPLYAEEEVTLDYPAALPEKTATP